MARPRTPIGTFGEVSYVTTATGRVASTAHAALDAMRAYRRMLTYRATASPGYS